MTTTDTDDQTAALAELDGGPHDLEFFFDPGCPFAWQTAVWVRRVVELRGISVGWRFISLAHINRDRELPERMREGHLCSQRYHRICAATRERFGNEAVGRLYQAWGERYWYTTGDGDIVERLAAAAERTDPAAILADLDLPADLLAAADDESYDAVLAAESDEAFRRAGSDVGTPIITYDPPHGNSLFGPVISSVPDDDTALAFYDALRTFVDMPFFSELKRSNRAPLDLPLFAQG